MSRPSPYPRELRERAVRMVAEVRPKYDSEHAAIGAAAHKLGIGTAETLRKWVRQAEVDASQRLGVSTDESAESKRLRRENAELRRANEIRDVVPARPPVRITAGLQHPVDRLAGPNPTTAGIGCWGAGAVRWTAGRLTVR